MGDENPPAKGVAPVIDWSASDNIERGEVAWPAPHRLVIEGLQNGVCENHVVLPVRLFLKAADAPARTMCRSPTRIISIASVGTEFL